MKIIQLIQKPQLRGAEIFACQLSQALVSKGHESVIVTVFDGNVSLPFNGTILSLNGSTENRIWDWRAWRKLARFIAQEKPDVIQANAGDTLKYAVFSKLFFRWKTPLVFRNASTISLYIRSRFSKLWNSFLFRSVTHILSVSEYSKRDFMSLFPEASKKISVVPIGVKLYPIVKTDLKKYGNPFFLHIGGFSFEKNHKGLISIFEQLKIKFSTAKLGLVGDGKLKAEIEREVAVRGLQDSVIFFGYQANPLQYLQVADCLLLPSIIEGMPAVILESFQCHVPVVAYDVGGVREIVKVDETGWLVEKNDELAFVTAVCDVMENSQKTMRQTQQAFELVEQLFNMEVISEKFLAAYIEILNKRELLF